MKTVMHPNMAEFEKMIGVRTLVQKSDDSGDDSTCLGSDTPSEEEGLICQLCHAVVKNQQGQQANGSGQPKRQYNRKPGPTNVTRQEKPCGSCGSTGHKTTECQSPKKYLQTTLDWIRNADCRACAGVGHLWKNCVDRICQKNYMAAQGWDTTSIEKEIREKGRKRTKA